MRVFRASPTYRPQGSAIHADQLTGTIEPGTPMQKVIPPRLVEPYLNGQRSVIAGYVYRVWDCTFRDPADFYEVLGLGYAGSEFSAGMPEIYVLRWRALDMGTSLVPPAAENGLGPPGPPRSAIPEFYTLPVPVPVGAEIYRIVAEGEEFIAQYDGQVWLHPARRL
ncbi:MAG: hypothetical protein QOJ73_6050 [Streptosporangiaceae bacterium]|jgi:hypothetical protein|nr:hypothetical protein [Streptosporangiaceae bacterium]